jgi:hypothetical protein
MLRTIADSIASLSESSIVDPPELAAALAEQRVLEQRLTHLADVADKRVPPSRSPAAMFLGSDVLSDELAEFVSAARSFAQGDVFVAALSHCASVQRELFQSRRELEELVAAKFVAPTRSFVGRDIARVREAQRTHEAAKRAYESARDRATACTAQKMPDAAKLLANEQDAHSTLARHREA